MLHSTSVLGRRARPSRRRSGATLVATTLVGAAVAVLSSAAPAAATTLSYRGQTQGDASTIVIDRGGPFERVLHPTGSVSASLDDSTHRVTSAQVAFAPAYTPVFDGPFGLSVYARVDVKQVGSASGTAVIKGSTGVDALTVHVKARLGITVLLAGPDGVAHPDTDPQLTDPSACGTELKLGLTGTANRRTGELVLSANPFTIPALPGGDPAAAQTCGVASAALNQQVAGSQNSIVLHFSGAPTTAHYTGVSRGSSSTVIIRKGTALQRVLHPTGSLVANIDFAHRRVTNVKARFDPFTIPALPGPLGMLPVDAHIVLSIVGTPTATIGPSGRPGIDRVSVSTTARMGVGISALGIATTSPSSCAVNLRLHLTGTVDRGTDKVEMAQSTVSVPSFSISGCGIMGPALSLLVSGSDNSIHLAYVNG